jgi:hypothetical protein
MEKTQLRPANDGITCSNCRCCCARGLESANIVHICVRYPPVRIGGPFPGPRTAQGQTLSIASDSQYPTIEDPLSQWCGEFSPSSTQ